MLPLSRNRTYGSSDPVVSGDINELQDSVIAGAHGAVVEDYWPGAAVLASASINGSGAVEWTGPGAAKLPLRAMVGDTLTGVVYRGHGNGAATADFTTAKAWCVRGDGSLVALGDTPANNLPNAWDDYPITFTAPFEVADGDSFFIEWVASAAGLQLGTVSLAKYHDIP